MDAVRERVAPARDYRDVLAGRDPDDVADNIAQLRNAGWTALDAQVDAKRFRQRFQAEDFDLDAEPPEPDYIVADLIERRTVNVLSGDTGAAKSIHALDGAVAMVNGTTWLGRAIDGEGLRVLYVDEENPSRVVHSRLRGLGLDNASKDNLRYFRRQGIQLDDCTEWLRGQCAEFRPDVIFVDTAMAATGVEVNDNTAVVAFYREVLRPIAEEYGLAVIVLHHERKPGAQEKRNAGMAMMGARQWAGQADVHMTLTAESGYVETPREHGGGVDTHKAFRFSVAKGRDGVPQRDERTHVRGVKVPMGHRSGFVLTDLRVEWEGPIEEGAVDMSREGILRTLGIDPDRKWGRKAVAAAMGEDDPAKPSGTFLRAWKTVKDDGLAEADGSGVRLTDAGRKAVDRLGLDL